MNEYYLEIAWNDLLSRNAEQIVKRFTSLDLESQKTVLTHLEKMVSEDGWQPEQQLSAQAALNAIHSRF